MDVYRGADKVAEFESYDELRVGANKPAFIYEGSELVHPAPVKNGLVLWYDFSGRTNDDAERGIAEDLSGNGHDGTLQNFNYTAESGYVGDGLKFDAVDDFTTTLSAVDWVDTGKVTAEVVLRTDFQDRQHFILGKHYASFDMALEGNSIKVWYSDGTTTNYRLSSFLNDVVSDGSTHHMVVIIHKNLSGVEIYIDGIKHDEEFKEDQFDLTGFSIHAFDIGRRVGRSTSYVGDIYSTRIYNRPLTPEEIAHNYAIEKERFGIE